MCSSTIGFGSSNPNTGQLQNILEHYMSGADISGIGFEKAAFCQVTDLNFRQLIACLFGAGLCTGNNNIEIPAEKEVIKRS